MKPSTNNQLVIIVSEVIINCIGPLWPVTKPNLCLRRKLLKNIFSAAAVWLSFELDSVLANVCLSCPHMRLGVGGGDQLIFQICYCEVENVSDEEISQVFIALIIQL